MKKFVTLVLTLALLATFLTVGAGAYQIGDVINYAQPTNIVASINGYQLMSYNVDGYTYIVAEDLRHYGFMVNYDNSTRSLSVERNSSVTTISPHVTNPDFWKIGSNKIKKNILYTDIVTYVNSSYVNSYNIDGATIIRFDELSVFGQVSYSEQKREISLSISDIKYNPVASLLDLSYDAEMENIAPVMSDAAKAAYGSQATCETFIRAKGSIIVYEFYLGGVEFSSSQKQTEQQALEYLSSDIKSTFITVKEYCPELNGVALIMYDGSGNEIASITIPLD